MNWRLWFKAAGVRAIKTWAQAALGMLGTGAVGVLAIDWVSLVSVATVAAIASLLTSLAGLPEVDGWAAPQFELFEDEDVADVPQETEGENGEG